MNTCTIVSKKIRNYLTYLDKDISDFIRDLDVSDNVAATDSTREEDRGKEEITILDSDDDCENEDSESSRNLSDDEYDRLHFGVIDDIEDDDEYDRMHFAAKDDEDDDCCIVEPVIEPSYPALPRDGNCSFEPNRSLGEKHSDDRHVQDETINIVQSYEEKNHHVNYNFRWQVSLKKLSYRMYVRKCAVNLKRLTIQKDSPSEESEEESVSIGTSMVSSDQLESIESSDDIDSLEEMEYLEFLELEGELEQEIAKEIGEILDSVLAGVVEEAVEPWTEYAGMTRRVKCELVTELVTQVEAGMAGDWDTMEITSQPAECSANKINNYYTTLCK